MKKNHLFTLTLFIMLTLFSNTIFAEEVTKSSAHSFGVLSLLPPLIAIILSFITKNVVISLFLGILSGTILLQLQGNNILMAISKGFFMVTTETLGSLSDSWNAGIILQCLTIGGLVALITKMGGAKAIAESLAKRAKSPKSTQIITWILGLLIFFDDYANSLIVGPIMRPISDKVKVSREKLAFVVDATAAPIAGIAVVSTWVGYELSLIRNGYDSIGQSVNAYNIFLSTIPYRFYNILILIFIILTAVLLREFGPMLSAERKARVATITENHIENSNSVETEEFAPKDNVKLSIWNAIIPIGVLVIGSFIGFYLNGYSSIMSGDNVDFINILNNYPYSFAALQTAFGQADASLVLFEAALLASVVAIVMGVAQKIFTINEGIEVWINGMKTLLITGVILILAWSLSSVIKQLGTADFLVSLLSNKIPTFIFPAIVFLLSSIISFATGSSYGTMGIVMPLTIPIAFSLAPDQSYMIASIGAVLTGAIFGDHCSPISDTTILSSMGTSCNHIDHVRTQLYYALTTAAVALLFGYIPVGLGMPVPIALLLCIVIIALIVRFVGKPVEEIN